MRALPAREPSTRATRRRLLALPAALLAAACGGGPRAAISNLDELYASRSEGEATYAAEVTDRGFFARAGDDLRGLFGDEPSGSAARETEPLEDPVEFAIENLRAIAEADPDELDPLERSLALGIVADVGRIDPSRIVRARAWDTALVLWRSLPGAEFSFDAAPVDEKALEAEIDALLRLGSAADLEHAALIVAGAPAELERGAGALAAARPDGFELTRKLLLLAAKCGRLVERVKGPPALAAALASAARSLAAQTAFLGARFDPKHRQGVAELAVEPCIASARLLLALDAAAATQELGRAYPGDALIRIGWLRALAESGVKGAAVHPTLREPVAFELEAADASVRWWARRSVAAALGRDAERTTVDELRAAWLALGDWDRLARS